MVHHRKNQLVMAMASPKIPKKSSPNWKFHMRKPTKLGNFRVFYVGVHIPYIEPWSIWKFHSFHWNLAVKFSILQTTWVNLPSYPSLLLSPGHPFPHLSNAPESQNQWIGFFRNIETGKPGFLSQNLHFSTKPKRSKSHCTSNPKPVTFEIFWDSRSLGDLVTSFRASLW